jgi:hypothetical protein
MKSFTPGQQSLIPPGNSFNTKFAGFIKLITLL